MKKIFSMIALMLMTAVGAMAQTTHTVTVMDGTEDAANWSIDPETAAEGQTVTIKYNGTKNVKSVKAVKKTIKRTPLTLLVTKAGKLRFYWSTYFGDLKYTVNGGAKQSAQTGDYIEDLQVGDVVAFYCDGTQEEVGGRLFDAPQTTIEAQVYGNVMSLLDGTNFATATEAGWAAFQYLFYDAAFLTNHPEKELVLPATTLGEQCYYDMFRNCTGLTRTPKLPAPTTLPYRCYMCMFQGCTGLTDAYVAAPYTNGDEEEMDKMFKDITADKLTLHTTADALSSWNSSGFSFKAVETDYPTE